MRGDFQGAREAFSQVIKKNPNDAAAYFRRGNSNYALREYQAALKDYSSAIERNPNDADIYYRRGNAYYASGKYAEALADFTPVGTAQSGKSRHLLPAGECSIRPGRV